ncbi:phosphate acyltransferase PlsX [Xinfangfangia sp. CPCC 101601]|uniref:Phosphate acyltransferase n=1 Tax=Pseudogemmobacter lacusdianii TaxID=3069608 RepID=A0ABU0VUU6_9RHOB|nr:phosphate acyltransferase PlsX [Xinfangfangia sp. CPCC 101601]MDQ2065507.1 phosphate acyltransferase PlsX [Xinfangfangia sp. CPCC 101601]
MVDGLQLPRTSDGTPIVISVDAMGGDLGPAAVVAGLALSAAALPDVRFVLHGDEAQLKPLMARHPELAAHVALRHAARVVSMEDKPSQIMRHGQGTSMWGAIDSLRDGEAGAAVSCGNTGALMAVSMLRLRKLPGVNRPAIACLWPSRSPSGFNVMLDVGADVKADPKDLLQYAVMGASYARNGMATKRPRVGLLNVGTEEHKGRAELKEASDLLAAQAAAGDYDYLGFVEGSDIPSDRVDVIVTDGFTGNVALKTGEGTAKLISGIMREELGRGLLSRIGALFSMRSLNRLKLRMDPRRVNGGVFLGLNGVVVKSHGSADATGISAAISLAAQLATARFHERLAARVASAGSTTQNDTAIISGDQTGAQTGQGSDPTQ